MKYHSYKHVLTNGYILKVLFYKGSKKYFGWKKDTWLVDIAVAKTERKLNNHYNSTRKSPKSLYNKSTNYKGGLEALRLTLIDIETFSKTLQPGSVIRVEASDPQREKVYNRLLRYGFTYASWYAPGAWFNKKVYYFKEIN